MSRITKWKADKVKVKVVFRLQFHATHISLTGWDKLFITLIPENSGKAIAKTSKASVRNGSCKWGDPIYETTRLLQDSKTKRYDEKLYNLVVGMGSSRSSVLGEAKINLADFADALKPCIVALPLNGNSSMPILHVTIQVLSSKTGFREFEQQRQLSERGLFTVSEDVLDYSGISNVPLSPDTVSGIVEKDNGGVDLKTEFKEFLPQETRINEENAKIVIGIIGLSSNASGSLNAEKHDTCTDSLRNTTCGDVDGFSLNEKPHPEKAEACDNHFWVSDYSVDMDSTNMNEVTNKLRSDLEVVESSLFNLNMEVDSLKTNASKIGSEMHKILEQVAAEITSGENLEKGVSLLKLECSAVKEDLECLKSSKLCSACSRYQTFSQNVDVVDQNIQSIWLKDLLVMEGKLREMQQKTSSGYNGRECFDTLHAEFDSVFGVIQGLKNAISESVHALTACPLEDYHIKVAKKVGLRETEAVASGAVFGVSLCGPEGRSNFSIPERSDIYGCTDTANALETRVLILTQELDASNAERDNLKQNLNQLGCYYEGLIQELEDDKIKIQEELQNLRSMHSASASHIEAMRVELNDQLLRLGKDRHELERRAITSEASLKQARLNYSLAAGQLQEDLDVLSSQVLSMFKTSECMIRQTCSMTPQPHLLGKLESARKSNLDGKLVVTAELLDYPCQNTLERKQCVKQNNSLGNLKESLHLQEKLHQKSKEEICDMHVQTVQLDVFSMILQEALLDAGDKFKFLHELVHKLEFSHMSQNSLMLKLQNTMDEVNALNACKARSIIVCNDMDSQIKDLEARLVNFSTENYILRERTIDLEAPIKQHKTCEDRLKACFAEKSQLENVLEQELLQNSFLRNESSSIREELNNVKKDANMLISALQNQQEVLIFLQDKLQFLLASHRKQLNMESEFRELSAQNEDCNELSITVLQLEEIQRKTEEKIFQVCTENKILLDERNIALASLEAAKSDGLSMAEKFEDDMQNVFRNITLYDAFLEKVLLKLDDIMNKFQLELGIEEKIWQQYIQVMPHLTYLEDVIEQFFSENAQFAERISMLEDHMNELGSNQKIAAKVTEENIAMCTSLEEKTEESVMMGLELCHLKQSMAYSHQGQKVNVFLEDAFADFTCGFGESHVKPLLFCQLKAEAIHFRQTTTNLESENCRLCELLAHHDAVISNLQKEISCMVNIEAQLSDMHERLVASDIELIAIRFQLESRIEMVVGQLQCCETSNHGFENHLCVIYELLFAQDIELTATRLQFKDQVEMLAEMLQSSEDHLRELKYSSLKMEIKNDKEKILLLENLELLRSEYVSLSVENSFIDADLKQCNNHGMNLQAILLDCNKQHHIEVERVQHLLMLSELDIESLILSEVGMEIKQVTLEGKLAEQIVLLKSWQESNEVMPKLRNQCNYLTRRLAEQVSLTDVLKGLKGKDEAERTRTYEKKEPQGPSFAMQESLRMMFMKEQYETKLQELRNQLSLSKKHGEELLWKLQDAINENEKIKKMEASSVKRNHELIAKIFELEAELHTLASDNGEKIRAHDQLKAEFERSLVSLECQKEERLILKSSLEECSEEKHRIAVELRSMKQQLQRIKCTLRCQELADFEFNEGMFDAHELISQDTVTQETLHFVRSRDEFLVADTGELHPEVHGGAENIQDEHGLLSKASIAEDDPVDAGAERSSFATYKLTSLRATLDLLSKENSTQLEMMNYDWRFEKFYELQNQEEVVRLEKASEELKNAYPSFKALPRNGNSLQRVLSLGIELADTLMSKNNISIPYERLDLIQHTSEGIFQNFRDISELIKDVLRLRRRNTAVEEELNEMHARYTQLSLQFAEVESDRQRLMMTLKNARPSKNP